MITSHMKQCKNQSIHLISKLLKKQRRLKRIQNQLTTIITMRTILQYRKEINEKKGFRISVSLFLDEPQIQLSFNVQNSEMNFFWTTILSICIALATCQNNADIINIQPKGLHKIAILMSSAIPSACIGSGDELTAQSGTVTLSDYAALASCKWKISASSTSKILLQYSFLDIAAGDYISIFSVIEFVFSVNC